MNWNNTRTFFVGVVLLLVLGVSLGLWASQEVKQDPPKLSLEEREQVEHLKNDYYTAYITLEQVQRKYEDQMRADPQYVAAKREEDDLSAKLQAKISEIQKRLGDKWTINPNDLTVSEKQKAPAEKK